MVHLERSKEGDWMVFEVWAPEQGEQGVWVAGLDKGRGEMKICPEHYSQRDQPFTSDFPLPLPLEVDGWDFG